MTLLDFKTKMSEKYYDKYDYEKINEADFYAGKNIDIYCIPHGKFSLTPTQHMSGLKCPKCFKLSKITTNEFINKVKKKWKFGYDYSKVKYYNSEFPITLICSKHGDFNISPEKHLGRGDGCPCCRYDKISKANLTCDRYTFKSRAILMYNNKYNYDNVHEFKNVSEKVIIVCHKHGEFRQTVKHHLAGHECPKCSRENRVNVYGFPFFRWVNICNEIHDNKYDYTKTEKEFGVRKKVTITCPEHGDFQQTASNHMLGSMCHSCMNKLNKSHTPNNKELFIENAKKVHNNFYIYPYDIVYINNKTPVKVICPLHGEFKVRPDLHLFSKNGCPVCNSSKGEKKLREILEDMGLKYIPQYSPEGCKYKYDFYLQGLDILVEYDGQQHFRPIDAFGGEAEFAKTVARDNEKNNLARLLKKELIRVPYKYFNNLKPYFLNRLSNIYRYYHNGVFYRTFLTFVKFNNFPSETTPNDVKEYLTINSF